MMAFFFKTQINPLLPQVPFGHSVLSYLERGKLGHKLAQLAPKNVRYCFDRADHVFLGGTLWKHLEP